MKNFTFYTYISIILDFFFFYFFQKTCNKKVFKEDMKTENKMNLKWFKYLVGHEV